MIDAVFKMLFACRHRRMTRPITPVHRPGTPAGESYVACLDCGARFPYDVVNLTIMTRPAASLASAMAKSRRSANTAVS